MIVEQDQRQKVRDTRVFRGFTFGSDHFFVGSRLFVGKLCQTKRKKVVCRKFRIGRLRDETIRDRFAAKFAEKVESLPTECEGIEVEWANFMKLVLGAAEECLGNVSSGGRNKKTG